MNWRTRAISGNSDKKVKSQERQNVDDHRQAHSSLATSIVDPMARLMTTLLDSNLSAARSTPSLSVAACVMWLCSLATPGFVSALVSSKLGRSNLAVQGSKP